MTSVVSNNKGDTILAAIATALSGATVNGVRIFESVAVYESRAEATDKRFTGSPVAGLVYVETDTYDIPDLEVGCVLNCDVLVAVKGDTPTQRRQLLTGKVAAVRNILDTSIPSDASGFPAGGDYYDRMTVGTPERDESAREPWAVAWLPVSVAYRTATRTTH